MLSGQCISKTEQYRALSARGFSRPEIIPARLLAGFIHLQQLCDEFTERPAWVVARSEGALGHGVLQHPCCDWVTFGLIRIEQARRRGSVRDLGEFPTEVHCVLEADVESLTTKRCMDVRSVTSEQHAVGDGLAGHVGESCDERRGVCAS